MRAEENFCSGAKIVKMIVYHAYTGTSNEVYGTKNMWHLSKKKAHVLLPALIFKQQNIEMWTASIEKNVITIAERYV